MTFAEFVKSAEALVPEERSVAVDVTHWRHAHRLHLTERISIFKVSVLPGLNRSDYESFSGATPEEALCKLAAATHPAPEVTPESLGEISPPTP